MQPAFVFSVLALLAATSYGERLVGGSRCTWGPAYWCKHVGSMKECNAAGYCSREWRRQEAQPSVSEECSFCRLLVGDLQKLLQSNRTEAEIRRQAEVACDLVPQPKLQWLCRAAVGNYLPQLLQLLRKELTPAKVCSALTLCGRRGPRDPLLRQPEPTPAPTLARVRLSGAPAASLLLRGAPMAGRGAGASVNVCDECQRVVGIVQKAVEDNKTEEGIADTVKALVCDQLGPLRAECDSLVDQYLPQLLALLDSAMNPKQLCQTLGLCPRSGRPSRFLRHPVLLLLRLQRESTKPLGGVECKVCEELVADARELIRNNKTEAEIIEFVKDKVCTLVPAEKDKCVRAVTEYGPIIFQLLASELDPLTVCQALGACGRTVASAQQLPGAKPQCILCEFVLRELQQLLGDNRTAAAVQSALEAVCSRLPQTLRQDCDEFVEEFEPVILRLLVQQLRPQQVCTLIGLCADKRQLLRLSQQAPAVTDANRCDTCQTVAAYAKTLAGQEASRSRVEKALQKVCNFVPLTEKWGCSRMLVRHSPLLADLLLRRLPPAAVCRRMGQCPAAAAAAVSGDTLLYESQSPVAVDEGVVELRQAPAA